MTPDTVGRARRRLQILSATLLIAIVLACCGGVALKFVCDDMTDQVALHDVSNRLGVAPEWPQVYLWLKTALRPGLSRAEVHAVFRSVGEVEVLVLAGEYRLWDPGRDPLAENEYMRFVSPAVARNLMTWNCRYDSQDRLRFCWLMES